MKTGIFRSTKQAGYTLVEVMISVAVLVIVSQAFTVFMTNVGQKSTGFQERVWGTEKCVAMLDELRSVVASGESGTDISALDQYADDDATFHYFLTTKEAVTHTGPVNNRVWITNNQEYLTASAYNSGNLIGKGGYLFVRNVKVLKVANDPKARKIYVRVYWAAANPGLTAASTPLPRTSTDIPLAELYYLVHTSGAVNVPMQHLDLYCVVLESSPGWWVRTASLQSLMQSSINNMCIRNPGLEIAAHWIRRMSFGRDKEYTPEINLAAYGATYGYDKAYVYLGATQYTDASTPELYYNPSWFLGRMNIDGATSTVPPINYSDSYAIADQFNYAMRLREEQAYFQLMQTVDANSGRSQAYVPEISYRMLLEAMNNDSDPLHTQVINSIIINLHGEMAPVPPLDNVSFAAKDPLLYPNTYFRAVTHPEKLCFDQSAEDPGIKVYSYTLNPSAQAETITPLIDQVTLFIPNLSTQNIKNVQRQEGDATHPYYWNLYDYTNPASRSSVTDGKTFAADNYIRNDGVGGLRVQLWGVSATCRAYYGPPHP